MNEWIVGNLCSLLAMVTDAVSSSRKTVRSALMVQSLGQLFHGIGTLALKGYSGVAQNAVGILRNFAAIRDIRSKWVEWSLLALGVVLGIGLNNLGWVGLLPVIANFQYTLAVFRFRERERMLKLSFLAAALMFSLFNTAIGNVVGVISNLVVAGTTVMYLVKNRA